MIEKLVLLLLLSYLLDSVSKLSGEEMPQGEKMGKGHDIPTHEKGTRERER